MAANQDSIRKRTFKLPGVHELTKEQEEAIGLPLDGQHLIVGGPGTGKSVVAILRAMALGRNDRRYLFLVYNHLLNQASRQLGNSLLVSRTWKEWFWNFFKDLTGAPPPLLANPDQEPRKEWRPYDWESIKRTVQMLPGLVKDSTPALIFDEGQDMPPAFYRTLVGLGFENFYVTADQNQQIIPNNNSSRKDIIEVLAIEEPAVIELTKNFRNTYSIALLARQFYTGDPASPPPELPTRPSHKRPLLFFYTSGQFGKMIERVLLISDSSPEKLVGIIAPNDKVRLRYFEALRVSTENRKLDNGPPPIMTYSYTVRNNEEFFFDQGGIMVINAQSCKGLEFDIVFLADINQFRFNPTDPDRTKRLFYVMVARAREQVIMLSQAEEHCPVEAMLPKNPNILERK